MQSAKMKCPHCGASIIIDPDAPDKVCKYCGASLVSDDPVSQNDAVIPSADPITEEQPSADEGPESAIARAKYIPNEETYQNMHFLMDLRKNRAIRLGGAGLLLMSGLQLYFVAGFAFIFIGKYYPGMQGKRTYKSLLDRFGGKAHLPCMVQTFFQDRVEVHAEKSENIRTYPYNKITDIRENANMLVLVFNKKIGIAVPRNAFIKGSAYDVSKLIRNNYKFAASTGLYTPHDVQEIIRKPNM